MGATNGPYSLAVPTNWGVIQNWVKDRTNKPTTVAAQVIFDELLASIDLGSCRYNKPITCEILPATCGQ